MIDWNAILQSLLTTGVVVAVLGFVAREAFKSTITHALDRQLEVQKTELGKQLEEFKAKLAADTALAQERRDQARNIAHRLTTAARRAREMCEMPDEDGYPRPELIEALATATNYLESDIHGARLTLNEVSPDLYTSVHALKNQLIGMRQNALHAKGWMSKGQPEKAEERRAEMDADGATIQDLVRRSVDQLTKFANLGGT